MLAYAIPVAYALFVWWFSTSVILYLDRLPGRPTGWLLLGCVPVAALAVWALLATAELATVQGAYTAFTAALVLWGVNELAFLTGAVTGPRRIPCAPGARSWRRAWQATEAILYHELALLGTGALILLVTAGGGNAVGSMTFALLWLLRLSAKLNLFLGVPNTAEELLPDHLGYLASFFTRRPMNFLFPLSITGATLAAAWLVHGAVAAGATDFAVAGGTLLATLALLGVLEHWFLVLPIPATALWRWSLGGSSEGSRPGALANGAAAATPSTTFTRRVPALAPVVPPTGHDRRPRGLALATPGRLRR